MNESVKEMLMNLKELEQDADPRMLSNPDAGFRLSETVSGGRNWRLIAEEAYIKGYIRYPIEGTYSSIARITAKGIDALNAELSNN